MNQEGATPKLTLVSSEPASGGTEYQTMLAEIVGKLSAQRIQGVDLNLPEAFQFLDAKRNNAVLRDWLVANRLMTDAGFERALKQHQRTEAIRERLGFVPNTCLDFVSQYAAKNSPIRRHAH